MWRSKEQTGPPACRRSTSACSWWGRTAVPCSWEVKLFSSAVNAWSASPPESAQHSFWIHPQRLPIRRSRYSTGQAWSVEKRRSFSSTPGISSRGLFGPQTCWYEVGVGFFLASSLTFEGKARLYRLSNTCSWFKFSLYTRLCVQRLCDIHFPLTLPLTIKVKAKNRTPT